jgi:hypothetical protein
VLCKVGKAKVIFFFKPQKGGIKIRKAFAQQSQVKLSLAN